MLGNEFIMELWDILNAKGEPTGKTVIRGGSTLRSGEYHLVVHIWPVNEYGSLLIQKRSKTKRLMPGIWAATGGAAISGESSFTAAARELYEELGIPSSEDSLRFVTRIKRRNSFVDVWTIKTKAKVPELKLQKSEVAEAKWVNKTTLSNMIQNGEYHNYGKEYFEQVWMIAENAKNEQGI